MLRRSLRVLPVGSQALRTSIARPLQCQFSSKSSKSKSSKSSKSAKPSKTAQALLDALKGAEQEIQAEHTAGDYSTYESISDGWKFEQEGGSVLLTRHYENREQLRASVECTDVEYIEAFDDDMGPEDYPDESDYEKDFTDGSEMEDASDAEYTPEPGGLSWPMTLTVSRGSTMLEFALTISPEREYKIESILVDELPSGWVKPPPFTQLPEELKEAWYDWLDERGVNELAQLVHDYASEKNLDAYSEYVAGMKRAVQAVPF